MKDHNQANRNKVKEETPDISSKLNRALGESEQRFVRFLLQIRRPLVIHMLKMY